MITIIKTATEIETTPEERIILEKESAPQMMTRSKNNRTGYKERNNHYRQNVGRMDRRSETREGN